MQQLIEVAPSSFNYAAETVALWSPGWPTPLRRAGAWSRRGCCALIGGRRVWTDRRESPGKRAKVARGVTGQRWRLSPRARNFGMFWSWCSVSGKPLLASFSDAFFMIRSQKAEQPWVKQQFEDEKPHRAGSSCPLRTGPCPPFCRRLIPAHLGRLTFTGGTGDTMAEHESPEFGKADFVLLDSVSMQEFMANLKLRWAFYLHPD